MDFEISDLFQPLVVEIGAGGGDGGYPHPQGERGDTHTHVSHTAGRRGRKGEREAREEGAR